MYTNLNYNPSGCSLDKSKSTNDFYRKATERSLKYQSQSQSATECMACKHERQRTGLTSGRSTPGTTYLDGKSVREEYYIRNEQDELLNLRKSKRFLEQLLERNKMDYKKSVDTYQKTLNSVRKERDEQNTAIVELQKLLHHKQTQQQYMVNTSLVRSFEQLSLQGDDQLKNKRIKQLMRKNQLLEVELTQTKAIAASERQKFEVLEVNLAKMKEYQIYVKQFQAMRVLLNKIEQQKLQLLNQHDKQLEQLEARHKQSKISQAQMIDQLKANLDSKVRLLEYRQKELQKININFTSHRGQEYEALLKLLNEREKQCNSLQSRLNCIQSELNFLKGRYGYILKLTQNNQLLESQGGSTEYCIQRIGRYNISVDNKK